MIVLVRKYNSKTDGLVAVIRMLLIYATQVT